MKWFPSPPKVATEVSPPRTRFRPSSHPAQAPVERPATKQAARSSEIVKFT